MRLCWGLLVGACCCVLVSWLVSRLCPGYVVDDAYMYVRYAAHLIGHGKVSWDPGGAPTYGLTSPLFLLVVAPLHACFPLDPAWTAFLASLSMGLAFLAMLFALLWRSLDASPGLKKAAILFVLLSLTHSGFSLAAHFGSGMDTTFALAALAGYLLAAARLEHSPTRGGAVLTGVLGGLMYLVRPDLMIYTLVVPLCAVLLAKDRRQRTGSFTVVGITLALLLVEMGAASLYFGSSVPLPFYAKSTAVYGDYFLSRYTGIAGRELRSYVESNWPLILMAFAPPLLELRAWWKRGGALEKGLVLATVISMVYFTFFVVQIMHFHQRFYYPTLPALVLLAARNFTRLVSDVLKTIGETWKSLRPAHAALGTVVLLVFLTPSAVSARREIRHAASKGHFPGFDIQAYDHDRNPQFWFCLSGFSKLPDDLVLATTEVGLPGALNLKKTVVDMSGLNESEFARTGCSARRLFEKYRPDLVYLPFPDYRDMIDDIMGSAYFKEQYDTYQPQRLGTEMGVSLLKESRHYRAMKSIVENALRRDATRSSSDAEWE